jgi:hypothetical protein
MKPREIIGQSMSCEKSEEFIVPQKQGNACGGKGFQIIIF